MGGKSSFIGLIVGFAAVFVSVILEGGSLVSLVNLSAAVLVIGGTFGAMLICHPLEDGAAAISGLATIMKHRPPDLEKTATSLVEVATVARREGLLAMEKIQMSDSFINQGLQIISDGLDPKVAETILLSKIETEQLEIKRRAAVYDTLGSYAPTMGIVGTVVGLINVLAHLEDTSTLGHSIASAFAATLYGIALANLVFLPLGARIRAIAREILRQREMMLEGILSVCQGENPRMVELKMATFLKRPLIQQEKTGDVA